MSGFKLKFPQNNQALPYPEHATAGSFKRGDVVALDTSNGKVRIAPNDQSIWGIARTDASGTEDTNIMVDVLSPEQIWVAYADTTTNQAHVGNNYGLNVASDDCTVDLGDASTTTVVIQGIDQRDTAGSTARVLVKFIPARIQSLTG